MEKKFCKKINQRSIMKKTMLAFMLLVLIKSNAQQFPSGWNPKKKDSTYTTIKQPIKKVNMTPEEKKINNDLIENLIAEFSQYAIIKNTREWQKGYICALEDCISFLKTKKID